MAYIFRKNATIPFSHTFYGATGGAIYPSSVKCWVTYASSGFPYCTERETTVFALTQATSTGPFDGSWSSTGASPGMVYWHIRAAETTVDVADGSFELRGNPAASAST